MGWFLRKSVRIGPVRFNLSKSGIGTSVGVKGFRIGVRPNGKSYIHAGRYGLYYRQELGQATAKDDSSQEPSEFIISDQGTRKYETASSKDLVSQSRKDLLEKLNNSYKAPRLDLIVGALFLILTFTSLNHNKVLTTISALIGIVAFILIARWETKRRTISLIYDFEDKKGEYFEKLIAAFNNLASNNSVWALIDSRDIDDIHESKLNAGADSLVNRSTAQIGEGKPPWVETNINIPVMKARNQTLYMMPDGILVYDNIGVGHVEYNELDVQADTTSFIEENPPNDAEIIDKTWKYPNKSGGPDRRFSNNYEIPICLYGKLKIKSTKGMFLYLMTSRHDSPSKFKSHLLSLVQ